MLLRNIIAYIILVVVLLNLITACTSKRVNNDPISGVVNAYDVDTLFTLGLSNQPSEYQLGDPVSVRTDKDQNIYIADRALHVIKVFNSQGTFVRDIGREGRGPNEFLDINTFEIFDDETLFVLDRGSLMYKFLTTQGKSINQIPVDFSMHWQFYPDAIRRDSDQFIALFNNGVFHLDKADNEKKLLHIYDGKLTNKDSSFFSFKEFDGLDVDTFTWIQFLGRPGSIAMNQKKNELYYSPQVYHQKVYTFTKKSDDWGFDSIIELENHQEEFITALTEAEFQSLRAKNAPGLSSMMYGGSTTAYYGRVNAFDAGIFHLTNNELVIFKGTWRTPLISEEMHDPIIDIYAATFKHGKNVSSFKKIFSVESTKSPWVPLINWMDNEGNFYLLNNGDVHYPTVLKFRINDL